jgi:hypothetical protein
MAGSPGTTWLNRNVIKVKINRDSKENTNLWKK